MQVSTRRRVTWQCVLGSCIYQEDAVNPETPQNSVQIQKYVVRTIPSPSGVFQVQPDRNEITFSLSAENEQQWNVTAVTVLEVLHQQRCLFCFCPQTWDFKLAAMKPLILQENPQSCCKGKVTDLYIQCPQFQFHICLLCFNYFIYEACGFLVIKIKVFGNTFISVFVLSGIVGGTSSGGTMPCLCGGESHDFLSFNWNPLISFYSLHENRTPAVGKCMFMWSCSF